jgi:hypothetical protein
MAFETMENWDGEAIYLLDDFELEHEHEEFLLNEYNDVDNEQEAFLDETMSDDSDEELEWMQDANGQLYYTYTINNGVHTIRPMENGLVWETGNVTYFIQNATIYHNNVAVGFINNDGQAEFN